MNTEERKETIYQLGLYARSAIELNLKNPEEIDEAWLFQKLVSKYKELNIATSEKE